MQMFRYSSLLWLCIVLTSVMFIISACTAQISGKAKEDSTWSAETRQLESEAAAYNGPQYTIGIVQFDDKATAIASGVGVAAAILFRTQLEAAGLNTILLDEKPFKEADKSKSLQRSGAVKNEKIDTDNGFDTPDFRLSGAITAYSEVEEGMDAIATQKKSVVVRVAVDYALIDFTTGKPLMSESGSGEFRKTTSGVKGLAARTSSDPNLRDGALRNAFARATVILIHKLGSMPFQGRLLAVDGPSLVLRAGRRSQLKDGTQLAVYRVGKALVDPDNGQVLGYRESKIGVIQISSHQNENLSLATVVSGSGFQPGDVVKPMP